MQLPKRNGQPLRAFRLTTDGDGTAHSGDRSGNFRATEVIADDWNGSDYCGVHLTLEKKKDEREREREREKKENVKDGVLDGAWMSSPFVAFCTESLFPLCGTVSSTVSIISIDRLVGAQWEWEHRNGNSVKLGNTRFPSVKMKSSALVSMLARFNFFHLLIFFLLLLAGTQLKWVFFSLAEWN